MPVDPQHHPVVVLGARFPALGVVHALAPEGVRCWVCDPRRLHATWSRHARYWRVPDPRDDPAGTVDRLLALAAKIGGRPIVIPTDDHYARVLAHHRERLLPHTIPCSASSDVVDLLTDHLRFCAWALARGMDCPKSAPADTAALPFPPPVVVKPLNFTSFLSLAASDLPSGEKPSDLRFRLIRSAQEWQDFQSKYRALLPHLLLQEYVEGSSADMFSIGVYSDRRSRLRGMFVGRKLRGYPAQYGNTILGQNDRIPEHVADEVELIVRELGYTGIAEFEYRREPETGRFRLIEINPRCWSWIVATRFSAANIPWIAYNDLSGEEGDVAIVNDTPGAIKTVRIMADLVNVFWRYRSDHPAWVMRPAPWWRSLRAEKLALVEFQAGDWPVALFCLAHLARELLAGER